MGVDDYVEASLALRRERRVLGRCHLDRDHGGQCCFASGIHHHRPDDSRPPKLYRERCPVMRMGLLQCPSCLCWREDEEIIVNCGICDDCFQRSCPCHEGNPRACPLHGNAARGQQPDVALYEGRNRDALDNRQRRFLETWLKLDMVVETFASAPVARWRARLPHFGEVSMLDGNPLWDSEIGRL